MTDVTKPHNDPYALIGENWPVESESAYHTAKIAADDASTAATTQAQSARDAEARMVDEHGKTAGAVSGGYGSTERELSEQSIAYTTISAWMTDAGGKVGGAKKHIASLVSTGTSEIRDAINSEMAGACVPPSSTDLITQYRNEIQSVYSKLSAQLDAIGHSLRGDSGSSATPAYVSVPTTPSVEHADPRVVVASYNSGDRPAVEPHQLPPMPRATSTPLSAESPSVPGTPSAPTAPATTRAVNPTLSNLISGSGPSGTPSSPSTSSKPASATATGTPAGQDHQAPEQHQQIRPTGLPRIPSIGLPNIPAAASAIATTVTSATGSQLLTAAPTSPGSSLPASTGITPGTSGTPPMTPTTPAGLAPIGGGLTPPPVMQAAPVSQASPAVPTPGVQTPSPQSPPPAPRGPVADMAWLQRTYGLAPGLDLPKSESSIVPAPFIAGLPEDEAHLHRALATLRHAFDDAGWGQPLAVASIRKGFETKTVYVTSDGLSIHPHGVLLPHGVLPLDEMPSTPTTPELLGSLMVTEKLTALIPRNWTVEAVLSTVPGGENSQSTEQFQLLVEVGELLECRGVRGRSDVTDDEALSLFARAAIGSRGCGDLDSDSARLQAARWVGTQPSGYGEVLSRWYLSDAAEAMSAGRWGEAVYSSERYMNLADTKKQVA